MALREVRERNNSEDIVATHQMSNLSLYCDNVRFINNDLTRDRYITGWVINQLFFIACLVHCSMHLKKLRAHAAREGKNQNFTRKGRTGAIIAAICACILGISYSTVIFVYKLDLQFDDSGRPLMRHNWMRWSYRSLQTFTLCL
jgi:hypothetical protein